MYWDCVVGVVSLNRLSRIKAAFCSFCKLFFFFLPFLLSTRSNRLLLTLTFYHTVLKCQEYYFSFSSSEGRLYPLVSLNGCCSSSAAYNWIWVWDRGPVGFEIKESRLSLHLWWGRQISLIYFLPFESFPFVFNQQ